MLTVMDDYGSPRVQAHAGAALVNFSEDCPKNILAPYLDLIIAKLEQVLTATFKQVHVMVVEILISLVYQSYCVFKCRQFALSFTSVRLFYI